jgi:hypothetical protein
MKNPTLRGILLNLAIVTLCIPAARAQVAITSIEPIYGRFSGEGEKISYTIKIEKDAETLRLQATSQTATVTLSLFNRRDQPISLQPLGSKGNNDPYGMVVSGSDVECSPRKPLPAGTYRLVVEAQNRGEGPYWIRVLEPSIGLPPRNSSRDGARTDNRSALKDDAAPLRADVDALKQRLDQLERRLQALERALRSRR